MEQWAPVKGYEDRYHVSDHGRVKGLCKNTILKPSISYSGYHRVKLYANGKSLTTGIHRLVAEAFLGPPDMPELQVNHIDGDKGNNSVSNLEWCTQSENLRHSYKIGLRDYNMMKLLEANHIEIYQLTKDGYKVRKWYSMSEAARALGLSVSNICNCCKGKIKSTGGFKWVKCSEI